MRMCRIEAIGVGFALIVGMALAAGCGADESGEPVSADGEAAAAQYVDSVDDELADHQWGRTVHIGKDADPEEYFSADGVAHFEYSEPFVQVGFMVGAAPNLEMQVRTRSDEQWSSWEQLEPYWSEERLHNAHVVLDAPADAMQWRVMGELDGARVTFYDQVTARDRIITGDVPSPRDEPSPAEVESRTQAVAPSSMVTSRYDWDAIDPGKICNSVVAPYRMAIHHTASPDSDGSDPHIPMRGMQSYHMNTLGWCDIGYHFVVAQSGEIMQGRSRSDRPGAHVGGQNSGNVGISMIGNYTSDSPTQAQYDGVVEMVRWVHEEHGVSLDSDSVRGHRDWPGQTTACPGNQGVTYVPDIIADAADSEPKPDPDPDTYDVDIDVSIQGLDNFYSQGTNETVADGFSGETFTVDIRVTNQSSVPIREVKLDYELDGVGLEIEDYRIESDHPEYDQDSWQTNSADPSETSDNPDADDLGDQFTLEMHAFSPQETKRVVFDMVAADYNIGMADFSGVRAWIRHIEDVYESQDSFGDSPSTNEIESGGLLQDSAGLNVLSRDEWQFRGDSEADLEGWTDGGGTEELKLNTGVEMLAQQIEGPYAFVDSPGWTLIDADRYDEMVFRARSHDGEYTRVVYWAGSDQSFDEQRSVRFQAPGDSEEHTQVVPLGEHPNWSGDVERLRLGVVDETPGEDDSGWYDIDHVYFQDRGEELTSSATLEVIDQTPVDIWLPEDLDEELDDSDQGGSLEGSIAGIPTDGHAAEVNEVFGGCSTAGTERNASMSLILAVVALGLAAMVVRRRKVLN